MEVLLIMFREGGQHRPFHVTDGVTVIGRREDCDLRIAVNDVSRKHCQIKLESGKLSVADLGSSNGTFVNGQRIQKHALAAGDTLQVGPVSFVVQIDGEPDLSNARGAAVKPQKAKSIDDELDELEILNDSGSDSDGGSLDFDLSEK